jgi:hypothetical protein
MEVQAGALCPANVSRYGPPITWKSSGGAARHSSRRRVCPVPVGEVADPVDAFPKLAVPAMRTDKDDKGMNSGAATRRREAAVERQRG